MKRALASLLFIAMVLGISPSWARAQSHPRFSTGLHFGVMFPSLGDFKKVYKDNYLFVYGLSFGWKIVKDLELGGEASYGFKDGYGVTDSGDRTKEAYRIHLVPAVLTLLYRFKFYEDQPVVPYVGVGGAYTYFYEARKSDKNVKTTGGKYGCAGLAGKLGLVFCGMAPGWI